MWNTAISATVHAKDYLTLHELVLQEKALGQMLIGPDVTKNDLEYFNKYIQHYDNKFGHVFYNVSAGL